MSATFCQTANTPLVQQPEVCHTTLPTLSGYIHQFTQKNELCDILSSMERPLLEEQSGWEKLWQKLEANAGTIELLEFCLKENMNTVIILTAGLLEQRFQLEKSMMNHTLVSFDQNGYYTNYTNKLLYKRTTKSLNEFLSVIYQARRHIYTTKKRLHLSKNISIHPRVLSIVRRALRDVCLDIYVSYRDDLEEVTSPWPLL